MKWLKHAFAIDFAWTKDQNQMKCSAYAGREGSVPRWFAGD